MLKFNVRKQTIKRVDSEKLVNKSVNFLSARFSFDDTWKNYNKYIIFNVNKKYNFLIKLKNINKDILIPWECLQDDGEELEFDLDYSYNTKQYQITNTISENSTNNEIPTAKAVWDLFQSLKEN